MIMMAIHVDDCYVIGKIDTINQAVKLKVEYNTKDYLSCEILFDKARTVASTTRPDEENQGKL
jgi:hypothetical protein